MTTGPQIFQKGTAKLDRSTGICGREKTFSGCLPGYVATALRLGGRFGKPPRSILAFLSGKHSYI
jgi:hypothetical protein